MDIMIYSWILLVAAASLCTAERCVQMDCSSWDFKFLSCPLPGAAAITRMNVARKYSKSSCSYGSSYGNGQGTIWVNRGCRARFNVCYETDIRCTSVDCSSADFKFSLCQVSGLVTNVRVVRKYSKSSCTLGHGYGKDGNKIWVNHGCRANFQACLAKDRGFLSHPTSLINASKPVKA